MEKYKFLLDIVSERRSVRVFDPSKYFPAEVVTKALNLAALSANSSNMQLWEFHRLKGCDFRDKMLPICLQQSAVRTAQEFVVFVCRPDKWRHRQKFNLDLFSQEESKLEVNKSYVNYYKKIIPSLYVNDRVGVIGYLRKIFVNIMGLFKPTYREVSLCDLQATLHKSCALAAQTFMLSVAAQGYSSCPLEGFDSVRLAKLLDLPGSALFTMVVAVGNIDPKKGIWSSRRRVDMSSVVIEHHLKEEGKHECRK
jgi:nitroreductase